MMQKGTAGVRFVAGAGRQGRYSRGAEEMRIDADADGQPCRFGNRFRH